MSARPRLVPLLAGFSTPPAAVMADSRARDAAAGKRAGQHPACLGETLDGYRRAAGLRSDARMTGAARPRADADTAAPATYLSTLK